MSTNREKADRMLDLSGGVDVPGVNPVLVAIQAQVYATLAQVDALDHIAELLDNIAASLSDGAAEKRPHMWGKRNSTG
jgi:hypothetical protein